MISSFFAGRAKKKPRPKAVALRRSQNSDLPILPSPATDWKVWKAQCLRGFLFGLLVGCCLANVRSDVTLAFKDAEIIQPFSTVTTVSNESTASTKSKESKEST